MSKTLKRIRQLNDELREFAGCGVDCVPNGGNAFSSDPGMVYMSRIVCGLDSQDRLSLLNTVSKFDNFKEDDEEHDFFSVYFKEQIYHGSIIYLDMPNDTPVGPSIDPSDPEITLRILVIRHRTENSLHV